MAGTIKGIIVEIGGDTSGLQKALKSVNSATSSLSKELRGVNSLLKLDPSNTELLAQKQAILAKNIEETSNKLDLLKRTQEEADNAMANGTDISGENYRNLQREIINTENKLKQLQLEASNWTQAGKKIEEFGNKVESISSKISNLGNTLTTSLTLPVLAIGTAAVTTGNDFEAQMSRVQAIAGATKDELEQLTDQAIDLGAKTSFSASEVAAGMENLASAGFTTQEIMEAMPGLLDLAASSGADLATSSEIAASAIRGFGLEASTSAHVADIFAEAAARTNAQTEDMGEAMKYVAPVAKTVGLSIEETAAAIGIMSDAGIKGSQAGTTLRGGLTRLIKPTKMVKDAMAELGVEFYDSDGKMKSLTEIIKTLQDHTKGLTDETKNQALAQIFGTEALSGMLALVNRGSDELADMTKSFEECDGAASDMADTMLDNTKGAFESLSGSLESAGIAIQQALAPEIKKLAKWIQGLVDDFNDLSDEEKQNIVRTGLLVAAIGPAIKILSTLGTGVGKVAKGIGTFSQAIGVLKTGAQSANTAVNTLSKIIGAITSPTGLAITAITALTAAFTANYIASTKEKASLGGLKEAVEEQTQSWNDLKTSRQEMLDSSTNEIVILENLAEELKTVADENGKVKAGYEDRAKVILTQLNQGLGTEYKLNGNIIEQYQSIKDNIDQIIAKKKAEAVLNAYQEEYGAALKNEAEATETLVGLKQKLSEAAEQMASGNAKERAEAELLYNSTAKKIKEQTDLISEYGKTISDYENLQSASVSGTAEEIDTAITKMGTSYDRAKEQMQGSIEEQITAQANYVASVRQALSDAKTANDEYQASVLQTQLDTEKKKLENLANSLVEQTSTIQELTPEQIEAWQSLAEQDYNIYNTAISKLPEATQQSIISATGIVPLCGADLTSAVGTVGTNSFILFRDNLQISSAAKSEIDSATDEVNNNETLGNAFKDKGSDADEDFRENINYTKGKEATSDYMSGANAGGDESKRSFWDLLFRIGKRGNQSMRDGLGDGSPSVLAKQAVIDYFKGADIGAEKQGPKTVSKIKDYAVKMNKAFGSSLDEVDINKKIGSLNGSVINGTKMIFTTPTLNIYTQGELNIRKVADEVNRIFGSKY